MKKDKSLVDKLTDIDADLVNTSDGLRIALRTVLGCDYKIQDAITNKDILLRLADAIGYEYLQRPKWEGGEPVHVYDCYMDDGELREVTGVLAHVRSDDGTDFRGELFGTYARIEPDTQERIDSDSELSPREYLSDVLETSIENLAECDMRYMMIRHLLRRQRELDRRDK